jgi:hypothetical protein
VPAAAKLDGVGSVIVSSARFDPAAGYRYRTLKYSGVSGTLDWESPSAYIGPDIGISLSTGMAMHLSDLRWQVRQHQLRMYHVTKYAARTVTSCGRSFTTDLSPRRSAERDRG